MRFPLLPAHSVPAAIENDAPTLLLNDWLAGWLAAWRPAANIPQVQSPATPAISVRRNHYLASVLLAAEPVDAAATAQAPVTGSNYYFQLCSLTLSLSLSLFLHRPPAPCDRVSEPWQRSNTLSLRPEPIAKTFLLGRAVLCQFIR